MHVRGVQVYPCIGTIPVFHPNLFFLEREKPEGHRQSLKPAELPNRRDSDSSLHPTRKCGLGKVIIAPALVDNIVRQPGDGRVRAIPVHMGANQT